LGHAAVGALYERPLSGIRRRIVLGFFLLALTSNVAMAQDDVPRMEAFGGFSYLPAGSEDFPRSTSFGFQTSITVNLNKWFGVVGDFGGQYSSSNLQHPLINGTVKTAIYEYLVGPRFSIRTQRANVFGHVLFGGASGRTDLGSFSDTEIAIGAGAGLDIGINSRIAIRAFQFDYLGSFTDMLENNVRLGTGIVIRF
jgi:hypothetical protein